MANATKAGARKGQTGRKRPSGHRVRASSTKSMKRKPIPPAVRVAVLLEAGYKCANPTCRNMLALEVHHIEWVKDGGQATVDNLVPLCGHCHNLHTVGHIPNEAIRTWKALLSSLNNPNRASVDLLLVLYSEDKRLEVSEEGLKKTPPSFRFTGDGLIGLAPLLTSGLVEISRRFSGAAAWGGGMPSFNVKLTGRGKDLVEAWRAGSETLIRDVLSTPREGDG